MCVCLLCVCLCGSCPLESEVRVCPITINTVALCTRHHTPWCRTEPAECHTWAPLLLHHRPPLLFLLLFYRFRSLDLFWGQVANRITRCMDSQTVTELFNPQSVHKWSQLAGQAVQFPPASPQNDKPRHFLTRAYFGFLDKINLPPSGREEIFMTGFISVHAKRQDRAIYYLLGPNCCYVENCSQGLWLLVRAL